MNAVISGTAGRALLVDGKSLMSFDVDDPSKLVERQRSDLLYLFGEGRDLRIIENSDIGSIAAELKSDSDSALALDLTLISLDEELESDIREGALRDLDELLVENQLVVRLESILYARPLPDDGDLVGALKLCTDSHLRNALSLLRRFEEHQAVIAEVSAAWDTIPTKVFGGYDQQARFQRIAVREGLFRNLVSSSECRSSISAFLTKAGLNHSVSHLRNYREVLRRWAHSLGRESEALVKARGSNELVAALSKLSKAGVRPPVQTSITYHFAMQARLALVLTDIIDSTVIGRRLGNEAWIKVLTRHFERARHYTAQYGGYEVKLVGDSCMIAFPTADKALLFALAFLKDTGDKLISIRAGIHVGTVEVVGNNLTGLMVPYTHRMLDAMKGGGIALSRIARSEIESELGSNVKCLGKIRPLLHDGLKGFSSDEEFWEIRPEN